MDTSQINKLCLKRYANYLGCLPIDELQDKTIRDKLCHDMTSGKFVIFNVDDSSKPGSHWVLLHRMTGGNLLFYDSFGAFGSDKVFSFTEFGDAEKTLIQSYDDLLDGQLFQFSIDFKYKNDFTFDSNRLNVLTLDKNLLRFYANYDNMSTPLFYLLDFLKLLCPSKSIHSIFYFTSQLQPFNSIVCGELSILIAESLFRILNILIDKKPDIVTLRMLNDRISNLFSTAYTPNIFVRLVKEYMLSIDPFYKVKTDNENYFKQLFSNESTKLIV